MTFEAFYETYYNLVLGYIIKRISEPQTAEDLAMDCFLSAYKKFGEFDEKKASYSTWIFVIVNNRLKNYYRDNRMFDELEEHIAEIDDSLNEVETACYLQEVRDQMYDALQELSELQRKIVIYKFFRDQNATQISQIVGIPAGSVRVQLSRGMKKLSGILMERGIRWEEDYG